MATILIGILAVIHNYQNYKRMKKFFSPNHVPMVEGILFNWEEHEDVQGGNKRPYLVIMVGSLYNLRQCLYFPLEGLLTISNITGEVSRQPFLCETIEKAELLVDMLHKGLKVEVMPLYKKL